MGIYGLHVQRRDFPVPDWLAQVVVHASGQALSQLGYGDLLIDEVVLGHKDSKRASRSEQRARLRLGPGGENGRPSDGRGQALEEAGLFDGFA